MNIYKFIFTCNINFLVQKSCYCTTFICINFFCDNLYICDGYKWSQFGYIQHSRSNS
ncbi:unnamed protein product [Callosobruchus maculatus]|uniref:Uncharacterized protein n=1 Tax=Callosobruchus maculatus TaxID=64391 RepID=A0A653CEL0_CALMS|nr:unnamed protein product [Callosobruchus maculatus]